MAEKHKIRCMYVRCSGFIDYKVSSQKSSFLFASLPYKKKMSWAAIVLGYQNDY